MNNEKGGAEKAQMTEEGNPLTMAVIGCLPDSVQQAIRSFSIRPGRQHITFAFPYMATILQRHFRYDVTIGCQNFSCSLVSCHGQQVVQGFESFVTYLSTTKLNVACPIVMFTLYQSGTSEGTIKHFQTLVRFLLSENDVLSQWKMPILVHDPASVSSDLVVSSCASSIMEIQTANLTSERHSPDDILLLVEERIVAPNVRSFEEHFDDHLRVACSNLMLQPPANFIGLVQRLRNFASGLMDHVDYKQTAFIIKSTANEPVAINFWRIWGQEVMFNEIFCKSTPLIPTSLLPIKEGLHSIIRSLRATEDIHSVTEVLSEPRCHCRNANAPEECPCTGKLRGSEAHSAFHRPPPSPRTPYSDALKAAAIHPGLLYRAEVNRQLSIGASHLRYPVVYKPKILIHNGHSC